MSQSNWEWRAKAAKKLRAEGEKFGEIGKRLGVSRQRAHQLVNSDSAGRPRGRPRKDQPQQVVHRHPPSSHNETG